MGRVKQVRKVPSHGVCGESGEIRGSGCDLRSGVWGDDKESADGIS